MGYVQEQEQFLLQLQVRSQRFTTVPERHSEDFSLGKSARGLDVAQRQAADALGRYLAEDYAAFWAFSPFPSPRLALIDAEGRVHISIPRAVHEPADAPMRIKGVGHASDTEVRWLALPGQADRMLALAPADLSVDPWPVASDKARQTYLTTLLDTQRFHAAGTASSMLAHRFWLMRERQGVLLGSGAVPSVSADGFSLMPDGLVLRLQSPTDGWIAYYLIPYGSFFKANFWLPLISLILTVLGLLAGLAYVGWHRRHVVEPARKDQIALLESEAFNRTLLDTAPIALCLLTRGEGKVVFASAQARSWLNLEPGKVVAPHLPGQEVMLRRVLDAQAPGILEQLDLSNGHSLHVAFTPTRYRQQDVVLCAVTDVTVQAEAQRALAQARSAAEQANQAKTSFLATMSHEIRTPLYGVLGTLELLALTRLDDTQQQYLVRLQSAAELLLQQISDVLDVSKIEAGQMPLATVLFNPRDLVQRCVAAYAALAQQKDLLLFCSIDIRTPEWCQGDVAHLRQIVANLISNAIKFTATGHIIVRLAVLREANDSKPWEMRLQVADTGAGIAEEHQAGLFTPFYRSHLGQASVLGAVRGTGLGLSICSSLAQMLGSEIKVSSAPGLGSSFSLDVFLLPAAAAEQQGDEPSPALQGLALWVRAPHGELSAHVCRWLCHWGADAQAAPVPLSSASGGRWLVDVMMPARAQPAGWDGRYLCLSPAQPPSTHPEIDGGSVDSIAWGLDALVHQRTAAAQPAVIPKLSLRVLVAEDNPINQATLTAQLEQLGCQVSLAGDGEEALVQWRIQPHDVVLTDVNMPRMDGYELTRRLRAQGAACPIIGITANALREEGQRCTESGMDAWLVKPIDLVSLGRLLRQWGAKNRGADGVPESAETLEGAGGAPADERWAVPARYRDVFRSTMARDLAALSRAIGQKDGRTVQQRLHRMRGGLKVVGLAEMAAHLAVLEEAVQREGWNEALQARLTAISDRLQAMLECV
ncbi:hybrid sensor histidine kinase/response regulator [Castellaniella sp.]|uniref:hybrid sensor histidine kinase/response regulator n=1 Tax=Castellaniella sp. TaxID=1955812 RepID=UPI002AFF22F9|nr:response regulator [Castellaniella sp.]